MSRYVTQDDGLFVQVVADAFNLTIHINESIPGFASVTNISRVSSETDTTVRNIGHINETHYVSTVPFNEETLVSSVIHNNEWELLHNNGSYSLGDDFNHSIFGIRLANVAIMS